MERSSVESHTPLAIIAFATSIVPVIGCSFLLAPVLAGALLLTAFAFVWRRWVRRRPRPLCWL